ncbi:MAG: UDP-glucose 4-epimerase [Thermomicrobiales bacterium]|jgi:UDP-glucose 4-epimerase|nr:UDP-glucose 4-epimerase [Thermomicrobiales bacterium]
MRVLVTGAAGRIGAHLTHALVREGHKVRAFVLPGDPRTDLIVGPGVELTPGRLEDADALRAAVRGVEAVYHLAGALTSRGNSDDEFFEFNLRGTFNLLTAVRDHAPNVRRFAYASSDAVYAAAPGTPACYLPIDEAHPCRPGSIYGASKVGAEELCLTFWRAYGIPATILRFGATADADELVDPRSVFARWLFLRAAIDLAAIVPDPTPAHAKALAILRGLDDGTERLVILADEQGNPEIRHWGDARDVAAGCLAVLDRPAADGEAFNLAGAAPFSAAELVCHIAARTGYEYVTARLPTARVPWHLSNAKARGLAGYAPTRTVFDMVDEAVDAQRARIDASPAETG